MESKKTMTKSEQARADAFADAETLRRAYKNTSPLPSRDLEAVMGHARLEDVGTIARACVHRAFCSIPMLREVGK